MLDFISSIFENFGIIIFISIMIFLLYIFWLLIELMMQKSTIRPNQSLNFNVRDSLNINEQQIETEICVICHEAISNKIELDCKHKFCIKCIMEYYRNHRQNFPCPVCHKIIYLINPLNVIRADENSEYYDLITEFNRDYLNGTNYYKFYFINFPYIFYRGIMNITEDLERAGYYFGFCVFTMFYFLMPYDLVPDYLNYIGYFDDLILIFASIFAITSCFYPDFKDKNDREYRLIRSN